MQPETTGGEWDGNGTKGMRPIYIKVSSAIDALLFLIPSNLYMGFIQCPGCHKTFSDRGYSRHITRTQNLRCRLSYVAPDPPRAPSIPPIPLHDSFEDDASNVDISMEDSASTAPALSGEFTSTHEGICLTDMTHTRDNPANLLYVRRQ
jgi:hypothetical protein